MAYPGGFLVAQNPRGHDFLNSTSIYNNYYALAMCAKQSYQIFEIHMRYYRNERLTSLALMHIHRDVRLFTGNVGHVYQAAPMTTQADQHGLVTLRDT